MRRIFDLYLDGNTPRDIAGRLNKERIPGPRGGVWNASTIGGSRTRRNGILQNDLYAGRIIWNRQSFVKDPETGKRISRPNPRDQWMQADAEHLRIIAAETWERAQGRGRRSRRHAAQGPAATSAFRPREVRQVRIGMIACGTRQARRAPDVLAPARNRPVRQRDRRAARRRRGTCAERDRGAPRRSRSRRRVCSRVSPYEPGT